jgi:hypothetical protein
MKSVARVTARKKEKQKMPNSLDLTDDERIVVEHLVDNAVDGEESTFPLPLDRVGLPPNAIPELAEPRRLDSAQRRLIQVALIRPDNLTQPQKDYLFELLVRVAGLILAKARRLKGCDADLILAHMKEFLR